VIEGFDTADPRAVRAPLGERQPTRQKSPVNPASVNKRCIASGVRGVQSTSSRSAYQGPASRQTCSSDAFAPLTMRRSAHQRSACSSDLKSRIVAHV
jgi:hypothetical protein